jgi:hypothetical protein
MRGEEKVLPILSTTKQSPTTPEYSHGRGLPFGISRHERKFFRPISFRRRRGNTPSPDKGRDEHTSIYGWRVHLQTFDEAKLVLSPHTTERVPLRVQRRNARSRARYPVRLCLYLTALSQRTLS